jgi:hypothetical protein
MKRARALVDGLPAEKRASGSYEIAIAQAEAGDTAAAVETVMKVVGQAMDTEEEAVVAGVLAAALVDHDGVKAKLEWIERLKSDDAKAYAWTSAAATLLPEEE